VLQSQLIVTPLVLLATLCFGLEGAAVGYTISHVVIAALLMR
jgi:hypothetical protein